MEDTPKWQFDSKNWFKPWDLGIQFRFYIILPLMHTHIVICIYIYIIQLYVLYIYICIYNYTLLFIYTVYMYELIDLYILTGISKYSPMTSRRPTHHDEGVHRHIGPVRKDAGLSITKADTLRKQKKNPEYS